MHTVGTETTVKNVHTAGVFGGNVTACKTGSVTRTALKALEEKSMAGLRRKVLWVK